MTNTAADLLPLADYQRQREHLFPSKDSLRWFIRQHHAALAERQALLMPARHTLVAPALFDAFVVEIGARRAASRGGRS